jgi:hypothetical protein
MRTRLLKWMIESAVPFLNNFRNPPKWPLTIDQHRLMQKGSLGNDVALFLDTRKLPLLAKYEIHDTIHVLAGYGTTPFEELKLQAFMVGNRSSTFPGKVLFILGLLIKPEFQKPLSYELRRGRNAEQITKYNFLELIKENTQALRTRLKIAAGSEG